MGKYGYMATVGADTSGLRSALKDVESEARNISRELSAVSEGMKIDPKNLELAKEKMNILSRAVENAKTRLDSLKAAQAGVDKAFSEGKLSQNQYDQFRRDVADAESQLRSFETQLKSTQGQINNFGKDTSGGSMFGDMFKANIFSDIAMDGIRLAEEAASSTARALAAIVNQAKDNYAEYEQLAGGVETLFKSSADTVKNYAANAYKDAGMSANEYMETVTGFSASLIQSLGGDTAKAAETANRAVIDMSDNFNKMGTPLESIKNAYQGFAKQNYTMLDNLKLGYGGTKTEMERLISDAAKMTDIQRELNITVNDGDLSFANIANAISVVQKNLGIMGTTAEEAENTIAGSVGSIKAAWDNLLTGIADENADLDQLIDNVVSSTETALKNIVPRIGQAIGGVGETISRLAPEIAEQLPELINEVLPSVADAAAELVAALGNTLLSSAPVLIDSAIGIIKTFVMYLDNAAGENISEAASEIVTQLADGIGELAPVLIPAAVDMIMGLVNGLLKNVGKIADAAVKLVEGLGNGIIDALPVLVEQLPEFVISLGEALLSLWETFNIDLPKKIGKMFTDGLKKSLENPSEIWNNWVDNGTAALESAVDRQKNKLNKIGGEIAEEIDKGMRTAMDDPNSAVNTMGKRYADEYKKAAETVKKTNYNDPDSAVNTMGKRYKEEAEAAAAANEEQLKSFIEAQDFKLKYSQITEAQYYAALKKQLDSYDNHESEIWQKKSEEWKKYNDQKVNEAEKAADASKKLAEDAEKERVNAIKAAWDEVTRQRDRGLIDEEKEYTLKAQIVKKYCNENESTWDSYYKWLYNYTKSKEDEIAKAQKKAWEDNTKTLADTLQKGYEDLVKQKEKVKNDLLNIDLSETVKDKDGKDVTVLTDLDAEMRKIDKYMNSMKKLKDAGASESLMERIGEMNYADGSRQNFMDTLLGLKPEKLQEYFSDWDKWQQKAEDASLTSVQDKKNDLDKAAAEAVTDIFGSMPESAYEDGLKTGTSYLQGVIDSMGGMADINFASGLLTAAGSSFRSNVDQSGASKEEKYVLYSTPITIQLNDKEYINTTIGELIDKGSRTGGNTFKL